MVTKQICAAALIGSGLAGAAAAQQTGPLPAQRAQGRAAPQTERCLHDRNESTAEQARRQEAIAAMRMIDWVVAGGARVPRPLQWRDVAREQRVDVLRGRPDAVGDLARKVLWGFDEPLPDWRIAWTWNGHRAVYSLTDERDPCAFTLSSDDPDVIPGAGGELKVVPLDGY